MGCCPRRPTCWRRGCGVEATAWQATVGSAGGCANGVNEQSSMEWWFRVIVRQHAQYWQESSCSFAHSPMPAVKQSSWALAL